MTHEQRSKCSVSALAILAAWTRIRLHFRRKDDKIALAVTTDECASTDCATRVGSPQNSQDTGTRAKRYADAVAIVDLRSSDPSGIAKAIVAACCEVHAEGGSARADTAVRLMAAQLAWACGANSDTESFGQLVAICRLRAVGW